MARQTFEKGEAVKMYRYSGGRFGPDTWSDMVVLEPDVPKGGAWKGDPVLYYVRVTVPNPQDEWQLRGIEIKNARNLIRKASDFADIQAEIDRKTAWAKKRGDEAEARHRLQDAAPDLLAALKGIAASDTGKREQRGGPTPSHYYVLSEKQVADMAAAIEKAS